MKNLLLIFLLIATVVFGGLYFRELRRQRNAQASAEQLRQTVSNLQSDLEEREKQAARLERQAEEARSEAAVKAQEAARLNDTIKQNLNKPTQPTHQLEASASPPTNSKPSNPFADMLKNPEMSELIKNQQKTALSAMIDKNYAQFFAQLQLTPEQSAALKEMIIKKQLEAAQMGLSMFTGDQDAAKRTELMQRIKSSTDAADAQIKEFLGDANFTQFQSYEKTMGERTAVSGFKDQLSGGSAPLTDSQEQQLVQALVQEREGFKFTTDYSDKSKFTGDFASMFNEEKMNGYFQEMGQLNQQYLARARNILLPDQLTAFEKYLNNQQTLQKAGMGMAAKMFAPAK